MEEDNVSLTLKDIEDAIKNFDPNELEEEIEKDSKKLSILCAGACGVGKSTLLNGLIGCKADSLHVGNTLRRGTVEVTERTFTLRGIAVTIWDTPGLEGSKIDRNYLEEIKEKCAGFDIFLYCIKADETRAIELSDDRSSLLRFTDLFGPELWKNAVVVLTFSNKIEDRCDEIAELYPDRNATREFKRKIDEWEMMIRKALERKMDMDSAKRVPVLPTGHPHCRDLPGYDFWLSRLFVNFEDRTKEDGKFSLLKINQHRFKTDVIGSNSSKDIEDQDLKLDSSFKKNAGIAAVVGTSIGVTGAVVGASIGATIGALAAGIPTFGVGAGVGLVLGGAIGVTAGGTTGAVTAGLMHWYARRRKMKQLKKL